MEKYTVEKLRLFLHYLVDHINDKGFLYAMWVKMEREQIKEIKAA